MLRKKIIKDGIRDHITDLIGMSFGYRFGCKKSAVLFHFSFPFSKKRPRTDETSITHLSGISTFPCGRLLQHHRACPSVALDKRFCIFFLKQYIISRIISNVNRFCTFRRILNTYLKYVYHSSDSAGALILLQNTVKKKDATAPHAMQRI